MTDGGGLYLEVTPTGSKFFFCLLKHVLFKILGAVPDNTKKCYKRTVCGRDV
jgi:hypothetical protein